MTLSALQKLEVSVQLGAQKLVLVRVAAENPNACSSHPLLSRRSARVIKVNAVQQLLDIQLADATRPATLGKFPEPIALHHYQILITHK